MTNPNQDQEFAEEYKYIRKDLKQVIFYNSLIIILLVGLYFADKAYHLLDKIQALL